MDKQPCKGCGKPVVWATTPEGNRIPLDPVAPTYEYMMMHEGPRCIKSEAMVSHFSTCPAANYFSGSKKKKEEKKDDRPENMQHCTVEGKTYDYRDVLKTLGWRWSPPLKAWEKHIADLEIDREAALVREKTEGLCRLACTTGDKRGVY